MKKHNICEYCDGKITNKKVLARFNYHGQTIYVADVPAGVCEKCGEQYFDAIIYKQLEDIARHRTRIRKRISFPLAEYDIFAR